MSEQGPVINTDYYAPLDLWQNIICNPSSRTAFIFVRDITTQKDPIDQHD